MTITLRNLRSSILALPIVCSVALIAALLASKATPQRPSSDLAAQRVRVARAYDQLPLRFEPNVGQARKGVDYIARGAGFSIYLSPVSATLASADASAKSGRPPIDSMRINFDGANRDASASPRDRLPGVSNYYVGSDPSNWHRGVPTFAQVEYRSTYPGIDVAYHGQSGRVEFDFELAPRADPSRIVMSVDRHVSVNRDGDAVIGPRGNSIVMRKPDAWQMLNGVRQPVAVGYRIAGRDKLALAVGKYDRNRPLTIDPIVIRYSSYVGGSAAEANAIAIDSNDAYIVGWAADDCAKCSTPFPTTTGPAYAGGTADAFVLALNPTGTAVIYSTLIGGSNYDTATSVAVDSSDAAYVAGYTQSADFATPTNTTSYGGNGDGWAAKFDSTGALLWARYIGGSSVDSAASIALPQGCAAPCAPVVAGFTDSANFPVSHGSFVGKEDAWVGQVASDGSSMTFTTLLGGSHRAHAAGVAVDGGGSIYLTGAADTANFPSDLAAPPGTFGGTTDAFVLKLNSTGSTIGYRTFLGGGGFDEGTGIALLPGCASSCNAYVVGTTLSPDFPLSVGTIPQRNFAGVADLFVDKVDSGGSTIYATFVGGAGGINLAASNGIAVDSSGDAFVTGQTSSTTFPTSADKVEGPSLNPNGNLFASTDDFTTLVGTNWVSSNGAPISGDHNGATQYIGSTAGLFSSADGTHFSQLAATGLPAGAVTAVHYEAGLTPNIIFAGTPTGLFLSKDGGSTFSATGLGSHPVTLIADLLAKKSPTLANTQVFAGTTDEGLQFSGKSQTTFVPCGGLVPANDFEVFSITADNVSGVVLAATNRGVFSSSDVGTATPPNFTPTNFNFDAVFSMDADKTQSVIYAGTLNDGVWVSTDDTNFTKATIPRPNPSVFALAHDGGTVPSTILAGVTSQYQSTVFVSADKGMTFTESTTGIDDFGGSLKALRSNLAGISQQADAIVTEINPSGSAITFSSYLGGPNFDAGSGIAVDSNSNIFLTGVTFSSAAFPIEPQPGAEQPDFGGLVNGYAARIGMTPESSVTATPTPTATSTSSGSPTPTATDATSTATPTATATASASVTATPTATATMVPEKPTIKPKKLKFGKVKSNTSSKPKSVSISLKKSKTAVPVLIFTPTISAGYTLVNNCPASLSPGGKCKMSVTFKPMAIGPANGSLMIFFNGIGSPVTVQLTGTGD